MENTKTLDTIFTNQKSFYNKAYTKQIGNYYYLYSYDTLVLTIVFENNKRYYFLNHDIKEVYLYSKTTLKHIIECLKQNNFDINNKKELIKNENVNI